MKSEEIPTFEEAIKRLEEIVNELEKEDVPLEKSLALFEEGVKLSRFCREKLDAVEKKIDILLKDEKGLIRREPFSFPPEETANRSKDY